MWTSPNPVTGLATSSPLSDVLFVCACFTLMNPVLVFFFGFGVFFFFWLCYIFNICLIVIFACLFFFSPNRADANIQISAHEEPDRCTCNPFYICIDLCFSLNVFCASNQHYIMIFNLLWRLKVFILLELCSGRRSIWRDKNISRYFKTCFYNTPYVFKILPSAQCL